MVAISYDTPGILKNFADRRKIRYPMLSDPDSAVIRSFGVFNESVAKDNPFYGIPHPVTFITDGRGKVEHKYFEESYRERQTLAGLLAKDYGVVPGAIPSTANAKHVKLRTAASSSAVRSGQRVLLSVEVEIPAGYHLYAPGVEGYSGVNWAMAETPVFKPHEVSYPPSRILYLKAIEEKVPVYERKIRLMRDITIGVDKAVRDEMKGTQELKIAGTFKYQACSDRLCYPPETVPLVWTFSFEAHDSERVPVELRKLK